MPWGESRVADVAGVRDSGPHHRGGALGGILSSRMAVNMIAGGVAGGVSKTLTAPLETIKMNLMVCPTGSAETARECGARIVRDGGWAGLWQGNLVNVCRGAPTKAIELTVFNLVKRQLAEARGQATARRGRRRRLRAAGRSGRSDEYVGVAVVQMDAGVHPAADSGAQEVATASPGAALEPDFPTLLVAGGLAGMVSTLVSFPLQTLQTRLTVRRGGAQTRGVMRALKQVVAESGPRGLYSGLRISLAGVIPQTAIQLAAYDSLKRAYRKHTGRENERLPPEAAMLFGVFASVAAASTVYPIEVVRRRLMAGTVRGHSVLVARQIFKAEGIAGFYRGLAISNARLIPAAGITFMTYEIVKDGVYRSRLDQGASKRITTVAPASLDDEESQALRGEGDRGKGISSGSSSESLSSDDDEETRRRKHGVGDD